MHRARWMARAIYSLKIYLFRKQFFMNNQEKKAIKRICIFIMKVYLPAWYSAPLSVAAPRNDLKFLKSLESFKKLDKEIGTATKAKMNAHLDYLSEINICLAFFDKDTAVEVKRKMVQNLARSPKSGKCEGAELSDYVTSKSKKFFEIMEIPVENFITSDPTQWETNEFFKQARQVCSSLAVVNDSAERAVALGSKYNDFATTDENQKRAMLANVFSHRKKIAKLSKGAIIKHHSNRF